ncbi:uroporphyrinogen-III synthase [Saccharothrix coeruleofusca]|uniref:uroporphyrinogen-III synthase n=1 Tax=Saccharothrix coeruleofusca TaxID=33919 RepID=UPI001AE99410|nr:uroporphyrinogen-III synthase [Saccharothrix coeruleofusca]MBP2340971.1 uroporphyrinogen-III synthase [Saccharothrix coeruleofusca]
MTEVGPLAGYTVGVTAARRADELSALLERKGATVLHGPAIRIVPLPDDAELLAATRRLVEQPVDVVVATTGIGFRGWVEAAEGWGLGARLLTRLGAARVLARGPKARGAVRAAGLVDAWSPESESNAELLDHLLRSGVAGLRIAVQLHGEPLPDFAAALREAGAEVVEVPVYRWTGPADPAPLERLLEAVLAGQVDALAFTSAPAAASVLRTARAMGRFDELVALLKRDVLVVGVGAITAGPLVAAGIPVTQPVRARMGALARELAVALPARATRLRIAGREIELRGQAVVVDGELRPVAPAPMAVLRVLAAARGRVVSRRDLLAALPGGGEEHAVETAIGRLRTALGEPRMVTTVVKRGYRLAMEPSEVAV